MYVNSTVFLEDMIKPTKIAMIHHTLIQHTPLICQINIYNINT